MVDIWKFNCKDNLKITCADGKVIEGNCITIDGPDEDETMEEDEIVIETAQGTIIGIPQSEVAKIEAMEL